MRYVLSLAVVFVVSSMTSACDGAGLQSPKASAAAASSQALPAAIPEAVAQEAAPVQKPQSLPGRASVAQCDKAIANITRIAVAEAQMRIPPGLAPAARKQALRRATKGIRSSEAELKEACRANMSPIEASCTAKAGSMADLITCDGKDATSET